MLLLLFFVAVCWRYCCCCSPISPIIDDGAINVIDDAVDAVRCWYMY